jgi:hypothetical protein
MLRRASLFALVSVLLAVGLTSTQEHYPIMEKIAEKVIQKYQTSSCQQLAQQKSQSPKGQQAQMEQRPLRKQPVAIPGKTRGVNEKGSPGG